MNNNVLIKIEKYIENNDIENALSLILSNESRYENNADFWNLKGVLCYKADEIAVAISCFSRAVELDLHHQGAGENLKYIRNQLIGNTNEDLSAMNDEQFITRIVGILEDMTSKIEACIISLNEGNLNACMPILRNVRNVMKLCSGEITRLKKIVSSRFMSNVFENILACLENCFQDYKQNYGEKLTLLVEFTLHPLIMELREEIYFFGLIYPHPAKMDNYYKNEFAIANANQYARQALKTGEYKYAVSILVPAYNKLEYTKLCVESILKYTTEIDYELILVNDGSSDGTKEYFESVPYRNKKIISCSKNNGAMLAFLIGARTAEGRVLATVNNDAIVTENWLENLLICLESDKKIGLVVPTTNSISNNQAISVNYETLEDMQTFAQRYNKSNPNRWFERERLCPFINVIPMSVYSSGICPDRIFQYGEFSDDDFSLQLRLKGYKLILAKDTFCHHFGSVSLGEAQKERNSLEISRGIFKQKNKLDAWHDFQNNVSNLLTNVEHKSNESISVLCIDPGFGMVPYQIRNSFKENGNPNVTLHNFSTDKKFINVSNKLFDHFISAETNTEVLELLYGKTFDLILLCKPIEEYTDGELLLKNIKTLLSDIGELRFLVSNPYSANTIVSLLSLNKNVLGEKFFKRFASQEAIEKVLSEGGFTSINKFGITSESSPIVVDAVKKMAPIINMEISSVQDILYSSDTLLFAVKA